MRSRRVRGGGALVALLAVVFAVVPAVLRGGKDTSELGGPTRAVLVSLDTPAPGTEATDVPTPGSHWAVVDVPESGSGRGPLDSGLIQAIVDSVHALLGQAETGSMLQLPVEGVAGGSGGSVRFGGSASPGETVALGPDGATAVLTIAILTIWTTQPVAPDPTTTTTARPDPATTTTTEPPSTTTTTTEPPSTTTTTTEPPSTTTTTEPPSTTTSTTAPASDPVSVPVTLQPAPQPFSGPRDARSWPFASNAAWNVPIGDGATFDSRSVVPGPFNINAASGYGVCVGGAGYALNTSCNTGEGHYSMYRADGVTVDEYYGYNSNTGGYVNHMVTDARGMGVGVGYDVATQMSQLGGLIRTWDLQQGVIRHALQFIAAPTVLSNKIVWPAVSADSYIGGNPNTGFVPYGGLLAIPSDATMPTGLSPAGQMIWTALRDYGAYVNDSQGVPGSQTQNFSSLRAEGAAGGALSSIGPDLKKIGEQLRWVTNSDRNQVGGPGARLASLAPDLVSPN